MHRLILCGVLLLLLNPVHVSAQQVPAENKQLAEWFQQAKLGIFIHWGYYSVDGIPESWSIWNKQISHAEYLKQANGFTAARYNPDQWAKLFRESGARYSVMTSKHHDGIALWNTSYSNLSIPKKTPARRDLIAPFCDALRKEGLKVGLYFSLCDWSHPDYPVPFSRANKPDSSYYTTDYPQKGQKDLQPWDRFLRYCHGQIEEINKRFHPDVMWFDGDWEHSAEEWKAKGIRDSLKGNNPEIIINSRLPGYGDYKTPEQDPPVARIEAPWELCMTINNSWGYQPRDTNFKSSYEIIRLFIECLSGGGNLLLDIGPREDGSIPQPEIDRLRDLGRWIRKHEEAVYPTIAGLPPGLFYGPTTISRDSQTVYLYLFDQPREMIALKGIIGTPFRIRMIGTQDTLSWFVRDTALWNEIPGIIYILTPKPIPDPFASVVAIDFDRPIRIYYK